MDVWRELGTITKGKIANFFITKPMDTLYFMNYAFGSNKVEQIFLKGKRM
jgi:imidazolonepropionase